MTDKPRREGYVAYCKEHLRDGIEECAKIFDRKEDAVAWIEKLANGHAGGNCEFALFELGDRIDLVEITEVTPQPALKRKRYIANG